MPRVWKIFVVLLSLSYTSELQAEEVYTIEYERINGLLIIKVSINNSQYQDFILDTGSEEVLLNKKVRAGGSAYQFSTVNGSIETSVSSPNTIRIGTFVQRHQEIYHTDMSAIEHYLNRSIAGIIGMGIFKNYNVLINYESGVVIISKESPELDLNASVSYPLATVQTIPVISVNYNGKNLYFGLDSGCSTHVLDSRLFDSMDIRSSNKEDTIHLMSHSLSEASLVTKVESDLFRDIVRQSDKFLIKDLAEVNEVLDVQLSGLLSPAQLHVRYVFLDFSRSQCVFGLPFPKWTYSNASF